MTITTTLGRKVNLMSLSHQSYVDLTALQYCAVAYAESASGFAEITTPSGQGVLSAGILQTYDVDDDEQGEVLVEGVSKAVADSTFNCGDELTISGVDGKLEAASGADYVIAISLEAATEADQEVTVRVVSPYQKNA